MIKNDLAVENYLKVDLQRNVKAFSPPTEIKPNSLRFSDFVVSHID